MMSSNSNNSGKDVVDAYSSQGGGGGGGTAGDQEGDAVANKRAALAGQWRTPPMPAYPSGYAPASHPHTHAPPPGQQPVQHPQASVQTTETSTDDLPNPNALPGNSEDYAKALQEAYRKGAEAAARLAQQQQAPMPTAASCPNFSTGPHGAPPPAGHQMHPPSQSPTSIPDPLNTSMPPPPPPAEYHPPVASATSTAYAPPPPAQQTQQPSHPSYGHPPQAPTTHHYHHPPPPTHHHAHPHQPPTHHHSHSAPHQVHAAPPPVSSAPPTEYAPAASASTSGTQPTATAAAPPPDAASKPPSGRSLSMPDMSAYAAKAEEDKRQKRLARNRASARLRRLRKKNLVDAYETEVGILEKTLKQLQAHEWGKDDDHKALLDALGMERGQQAITPEQRTEIIRDILKQQMQQVQLLRQAQVEQECLAMLADDENCDDEMARELQELLQLSDSQKADLRESSKGLDKEVQALETVAASLQAMQENDWLLNEGVQKITDQFTSILHKNQQSKFLLWTDANAEAIDQLDHVKVQPLQSAPIFSFGVETAPVDDDEK